PAHCPHIVPGHQVVGRVEKLGAGASRFAVGDRVGIAWLRFTCGKCKFCRSGRENLCPFAKFTGYDDNGGYAQFAVVREDFAYAIPNNLDDIAATPLLCAGIIGFAALKRAEVKPNTRVGMFGFGSSAHVSIQVARHWGCQVYVMTRDARHQQLARELGATWTGGSRDLPPEKLDSAILFAPVGDLVPPAMETLDTGGTLAVAGIYLTQIPPLDYEKHLFHAKTLRSVTANTRKDGEELLQIASEIPLRPRTETFPLSEANRALQLMKNDGINGTAVLLME
ncbi:MAG TPA: zinc-dependent alcohol dehydrogenase family protein, partial [Tepidisphaeraceae bacterium]|nr:zinc-dependent alcohol dehydrogenase family protein [Tepidisphaeraceae bacterium]